MVPHFAGQPPQGYETESRICQRFPAIPLTYLALPILPPPACARPLTKAEEDTSGYHILVFFIPGADSESTQTVSVWLPPSGSRSATRARYPGEEKGEWNGTGRTSPPGYSLRLRPASPKTYSAALVLGKSMRGDESSQDNPPGLLRPPPENSRRAGSAAHLSIFSPHNSRPSPAITPPPAPRK